MSKHWYSKSTQVFWTCKALTDGRIITHMDEIGEMRGWRLGAIVHNLRRRYGWPIEVEYKGPERVAHYRLRPAFVWQALRFPRSAMGVREALKVAQGRKGGTADG